jgi:hypothetical protein
VPFLGFALLWQRIRSCDPVVMYVLLSVLGPVFHRDGVVGTSR